MESPTAPSDLTLSDFERSVSLSLVDLYIICSILMLDGGQNENVDCRCYSVNLLLFIFRYSCGVVYQGKVLAL